MTLTRATVTAASRIMLPVDAILSAWIGAAWALQSDARTAIPSLYALRHVWPISATGAVLVILAVAVTVGLLLHNRAITAMALGASVVAYVFLAVAISWSLAGGQVASWSAPAWPLYVAVAHFASLVSLAQYELTDDHRNGAGE